MMVPRLRLLLLGTLLVTGCAGGIARLAGESPPLRYADYAGEPVHEFRVGNLNGWNPVSRNQLVVWNNVNEAYLITVWETCREIPFAERIRVTSTNRVVSTLEQVEVRGQHCPIQEIRPVDVQRMRADRVRLAGAGQAG